MFTVSPQRHNMSPIGADAVAACLLILTSQNEHEGTKHQYFVFTFLDRALFIDQK